MGNEKILDFVADGGYGGPTSSGWDIKIDTCDLGHRFARLSDHPTKDGQARCPHCMAIGLDGTRGHDYWRRLAYARLGAIRDSMTEDEVNIVQDFLGPL